MSSRTFRHYHARMAGHVLQAGSDFQFRLSGENRAHRLILQVANLHQ